MKGILLILENFECGGVETYVLTLAKKISKMHPVVIVSGGGKMCEELKDYNIEHYKINFFDLREENIKKNIKTIINIIREKNIGIVNINPFFTYYPSIYAASYCGIPYVLTIHDAIGKKSWEYISEEYTLFLENVAYKYAQNIIFVSEESKDKYLNDFFIENNNLSVISNGIDLDEFSLNNNLSVDFMNKFLIVSRLDESKKKSILNGIELFIKYADNNKSKMCSLEIAGTGNAFSEIEEYIKSFKSYDIKMLGNISKISTVIKKSDVIIGMGRVALESMACGKITVLSGYQHIKGVVLPSKIDLIGKANFSGRNIKDLSIDEVVSYLTGLTESRKETIIFQNYQIIKEKFDAKVNTKKILDVFNKAINEEKNINYINPKITQFLELKYYYDKLKINLNYCNDLIRKQEADINQLKKENEIVCNNNNLLNENIKEINSYNKQLNCKLKSLLIKEEELNKIHLSRAWKVITKLYKLRDKVLLR